MKSARREAFRLGGMDLSAFLKRHAPLRARPRPSSSSSIPQAFSEDEDEDEGRGRRAWPSFNHALGLAFLLGSAGVLSAADSLAWRVAQSRVDAQIESWKLPRVLQEISAATGWQIFLEPDTDQPVSAKFRDQPTGEALRLLLGKLNFALLPQTNGPAKFFVYRTSIQEATQLIRLPEKRVPGQPIPDELVVRLKAGESIDELARQLGAKVTGRIDGLDAYRLKFEDEAAAKTARAKLASDENVERVDSNYPADSPNRTDRLALSSPQATSLRPSVSSDKNKVVIGLIDTAVQPQSAPISDFLLSPLSVAGQASPPEDSPTHGTAMSETILAGLAQASRDSTTPVRILPVDVYGGKETTTTFDISKGIYAAIQAGATVINLSLGSEGQSDFLHSVIRTAHDQGVIFLGAAGNEPSGAPHFPAAYPEVIAVTAGDRRGNIASYANRGDFMDVIGPGSNIIQFNDGSYVITGTSAATAFVSGTAAALKAASGKSPAEVEQLLREVLAPKPVPKP